MFLLVDVFSCILDKKPNCEAFAYRLGDLLQASTDVCVRSNEAGEENGRCIFTPDTYTDIVLRVQRSFIATVVPSAANRSLLMHVVCFVCQLQ